MGQDHTLGAELERMTKRVGMDPRTYDAEPGQEIEYDFTADSLYVHVPAVDANGDVKTVGMNLLRGVFARPK